MISQEWEDLRSSARAAADQLARGPKEWPGRPSAQRLAFFLEATPERILRLLDEYEGLLDGLTEAIYTP